MQTQRERQPEDLVCFACSRFALRRDDCQHSEDERIGRLGRNDYVQTKVAPVTIVCWACGEAGHRKAHCATLKTKQQGTIDSCFGCHQQEQRGICRHNDGQRNGPSWWRRIEQGTNDSEQIGWCNTGAYPHQSDRPRVECHRSQQFVH